jgi:hypothetical protein
MLSAFSVSAREAVPCCSAFSKKVASCLSVFSEGAMGKAASTFALGDQVGSGRWTFRWRGFELQSGTIGAGQEEKRDPQRL